MTEQEKREKLIEELAQFMGECEIEKKSCAECKGSPDVQCGAWNEAVRLYNYIEEARKETAKEIFTKLINACKWDGHTVNLYQVEIAKFAKEYGVEVEE